MRHPALILFAIALIINVGCGRPPMSEELAAETLASLPMTDGTATKAPVDADSEVTLENFNGLIQQLASDSSFQRAANMRAAFSSNGAKLDLTQLTQLISLFQGQNGKKPNLLNIAQALIQMNGGNSSSTGSKLDSILAIINQLAPLIATIAPQFAPILAAVTTILPMVVNIISLFKKPKATSASAMSLFPAHSRA